MVDLWHKRENQPLKTVGFSNLRHNVRMKEAGIIIGARFGRWQVVSQPEIKYQGDGQAKWSVDCKCDCGNTSSVWVSNLKSGGSKSCGCLHRELLAKRNGKHGYAKRGELSDEWHIWTQMMQRCENPNNKNFPKYGGAGISVCERWKEFKNFIADMGKKPTPKHSIDRFPDGRGNYEPGNCRWATPTEQSRNRSSVILIEIGKKTKCVTEWAAIYGVAKQTAISRIGLGWNPVNAVTCPAGKCSKNVCHCFD